MSKKRKKVNMRKTARAASRRTDTVARKVESRPGGRVATAKYRFAKRKAQTVQKKATKVKKRAKRRVK